MCLFVCVSTFVFYWLVGWLVSCLFLLFVWLVDCVWDSLRMWLLAFCYVNVCVFVGFVVSLFVCLFVLCLVFVCY